MLQGESHVFGHYIMAYAIYHVLLNICIKVKKNNNHSSHCELGYLWISHLKISRAKISWATGSTSSH